jgi:hypothetical protein
MSGSDWRGTNVKALFFGLSGFFLLFAVLMYYEHNKPQPQTIVVDRAVPASLPPDHPPTADLPPSAPIVTPTVGALLTPAPADPVRWDTATGEWKTVNLVGLKDVVGTWKVVIPANIEVFTGLTATLGQTITFSARKGEVKLDPAETFTNSPQGGFPTDKVTTKFPEPFTYPPAWTGALLCRLGSDGVYFDVGGRVGDSITANRSGELILSINTLKGERRNASGGYTVNVSIQ